MSISKFNFEKKHKYFNELYSDLHSSSDARIFTKSKPDFDFRFKDNKLMYSKDNDIDYSKSKTLKSVYDSHEPLNEKKVQDKISFYLTNKLVPVSVCLISRGTIRKVLMNLQKLKDFNLLK
jgi:hypothetical protein